MSVAWCVVSQLFLQDAAVLSVETSNSVAFMFGSVSDIAEDIAD